MRIEINCDVGELSKEIDDSILPFVSSCNVCCGVHAGDDDLIDSTIAKAIELGVNLGAHPSWPDREHYGRKSMNLPLDELKSSLRDQILYIKDKVESKQGILRHVKPHGALYHDVLCKPEIATLFMNVISEIDSGLAIYAMAGSEFAENCTEQGLRFVHEAFGDRRYESATQLRSRNHNDALIESKADFCDHIERLLSFKIVDIQNVTHRMPVQTICLHSDTPNAIEFARLAHEIIQAKYN